MRTAIILAALIALTAPAGAHSWYGGGCCNDRDCAPIDASRLRQQSDGMAVQNDAGDWSVIPWGSPNIKTTPMDATEPYHACFFGQSAVWGDDAGKARCVYLPQAGG